MRPINMYKLSFFPLPPTFGQTGRLRGLISQASEPCWIEPTTSWRFRCCKAFYQLWCHVGNLRLAGADFGSKFAGRKNTNTFRFMKGKSDLIYFHFSNVILRKHSQNNAVCLNLIAFTHGSGKTRKSMRKHTSCHETTRLNLDVLKRHTLRHLLRLVCGL